MYHLSLYISLNSVEAVVASLEVVDAAVAASVADSAVVLVATFQTHLILLPTSPALPARIHHRMVEADHQVQLGVALAAEIDRTLVTAIADVDPALAAAIAGVIAPEAVIDVEYHLQNNL